MHPIITKIFGIPVYSYGFFMAVAFLLCLCLVAQRAKTFGIVREHILDVCFYVFISGLAGARLFYVVMDLPYYLKNPLEIFQLQKGGLVFYGGIIMALAAGILVIKKYKLPLGKTVDLLVLYLPLGHAIARVGCFLNGCCYGKPTGVLWAVQFPQNSLPGIRFGSMHIHPVQFYSSLVDIGIFLILSCIPRRRFSGELVFFYFILYGTGRFFLELFRADTLILVWGLNIFQLISLGIVILGLVLRPVFGKYARGSL